MHKSHELQQYHLKIKILEISEDKIIILINNQIIFIDKLVPKKNDKVKEIDVNLKFLYLQKEVISELERDSSLENFIKCENKFKDFLQQNPDCPESILKCCFDFNKFSLKFSYLSLKETVLSHQNCSKDLFNYIIQKEKQTLRPSLVQKIILHKNFNQDSIDIINNDTFVNLFIHLMDVKNSKHQLFFEKIAEYALKNKNIEVLKTILTRKDSPNNYWYKIMYFLYSNEELFQAISKLFEIDWEKTPLHQSEPKTQNINENQAQVKKDNNHFKTKVKKDNNFTTKVKNENNFITKVKKDNNFTTKVKKDNNFTTKVKNGGIQIKTKKHGSYSNKT